MKVTMTRDRFDAVERYIAELEVLTSKQQFTKKDEARQAFLLSAISALKAGATASEVRNFEVNRLLAASGYRVAEAPRAQLPSEAEREWRDFFSRRPIPKTLTPSEAEVRANEAGQQPITYTQGAAGGYFVPQGFSERAFWSMRQYDQIFDPLFSNIVETETGSNMPFPMIDDVTNSSVQVSESAQSSEVDVANFGSTQLNAYSFRSKVVAVSLELLQDSNFPLPAVLERAFALRHARGVGAALVNGSGVSAPTGLITGLQSAGAAVVVASGSSTNTGGSETGSASIGTQDINSAYHKLDQAYRPGAAWYMNDATLQYLEGLLDKMGRPVVRFGKGLADDGVVPYIYGKPVAVCPSFPSMGSGKNAAVLASPLYFVQRRVPGASYVRAFWESPTLVQYGLVGFESWMRVDSGVVSANPSFVPGVILQSHS